MLGHRVGDGPPLEDTIDVKEEPLNSTHLQRDPAKCEEVKATIPLNDIPVELEKEPTDISGAIKYFENGEKVNNAQKQTFPCPLLNCSWHYGLNISFLRSSYSFLRPDM